MATPPADLITLTAGAKLYKVGEATIYRLLRDKKLKRYVRVGDRHTFVSKKELSTALKFTEKRATKR